MQTDKNGCGWVRMSALGHRGHGKTRKQGKQTKKNGCEVHTLGDMTGEISSNMMFLQIRSKGVQRYVNE